MAASDKIHRCCLKNPIQWLTITVICNSYSSASYLLLTGNLGTFIFLSLKKGIVKCSERQQKGSAESSSLVQKIKPTKH